MIHTVGFSALEDGNLTDIIKNFPELEFLSISFEILFSFL